MSEQISPQRLEHDDERGFLAMYALYEASLPASERKSRDAIHAMLDRSDYLVTVVEHDGRIVGFYVLFLPVDETFCLLEYLAVDEANRGGGIGTQLLSHAAQCAADAGRREILVEVDSDVEPGPDRALRARRQEFYRRFGYRRIDGLSYLLPLATEPPPPAMHLFVFTMPRLLEVPKSMLRRWLTVLYVQVYGVSTEDARVGRMLEPVADPVRVT